MVCSREGDSSVKKAPYAQIKASLSKNNLKIKGHSSRELVAGNAKFKQSRYINKFYEFANKAKASKYDVILKDGYAEANLKTDLTTGGFSLLIESKNDAFNSFANSNTSDVKLIGTDKSEAKKYYIAKVAIESNAAITGSADVKVISKNVANNKQIFNIGDEILNTVSKSTFSSYNNKILSFGSTVKINEKYDAILIENYLESDLLSDVTTNGFSYLVSIGSSNKVDFEKNVINKKYIAISKDKETLYYLIKPTQIQVYSAAQSLQESEVEGILPPNKVSSGTKGGVYVQGPSFIPVHANKRENKAVALFIKWFLSDKKYNWKDSKDNRYITSTSITPLKYWLVKANYITPTSEAFSDDSDVKTAIDAGLSNPKTKKYWLGVNIAWKIFNKAKADSNLNPIIQPVDDFSSVARNNVTDVAIKNIYTEAHTDGVISSFEDIYKEMTKLAKSADIL